MKDISLVSLMDKIGNRNISLAHNTIASPSLLLHHQLNLSRTICFENKSLQVEIIPAKLPSNYQIGPGAGWRNWSLILMKVSAMNLRKK